MFELNYRLIYILIAVGIICVVYQLGMIYHYGISRFVHQDPLNRTIYLDISYWPLTHFMMHLVLTYVYPMSVGLIFVMGLLWEFFEWLAGKILGRFAMDLDIIADHHVQYADPRQIGSLRDLWFNALGNIIGLLLKHSDLSV